VDSCEHGNESTGSVSTTQLAQLVIYPVCCCYSKIWGKFPQHFEVIWSGWDSY